MIGRRARELYARIRDVGRPSAEPTSKDPAKVFDAILATKNRHYQDLRSAVAAILYLRNRIEGDIRERRAEIARVHDELRTMAKRGDDHLALLLIGQKRALFEELSRAEAELAEVKGEAEEAKQELGAQRQAIRALERERLRAMTTVASARARRQIDGAVADLDRTGSGSALEEIREEMARISAEQALDKELGSDAWERAHGRSLPPAVSLEGARAELEALKKELSVAPRRSI